MMAGTGVTGRGLNPTTPSAEVAETALILEKYKPLKLEGSLECMNVEKKNMKGNSVIQSLGQNETMKISECRGLTLGYCI